MTKPVIIKREVKGTPLTYAELDTNFQNLDDATINFTGNTGDTRSMDLNDTTSVVGVLEHNITVAVSESGQSITIDNTLGNYTKEPMGFENRTDSTVSFDAGTRTLTVAPTTTTFRFWVQGRQFTRTTSDTKQLPNTSGLYYFYYDSLGVIQVATSFSFGEHCPIAAVQWNASTGAYYFLGEERHGITMDWSTHEYLNATRGLQYASGFSATNYTTTGSGAVDADAQIDLTDGVCYQEDIKISIVHSNTPTYSLFQQDMAGPGRFPVTYHSGSTGEWVKDSATDFPVKYITSRIAYNLNTAGTWTAQEASANHYVAVWLVATANIKDGPIVSVMGQREDVNIGNAVDNNIFSNLDLTNFPGSESRPLYRLIYQTGSYGNAVNAKLVHIEDVRREAVRSTLGGSVSGLANISEDLNPQLGGNLDVNGFSIVSASNGNIAITPNGTGNLVLDGLNWPQADGSANYVLQTNGSGQLSWVAQATGGLDNVVEDLTPQLGGDLDLNGFRIKDGTDIIAENLNGSLALYEGLQVGSGNLVMSNPTYAITSQSNENLTLKSLKTSSATAATIVLEGASNGGITLTADGTGRIHLASELRTTPTSGTPSNFENTYFEGSLAEPVTWLKILNGTVLPRTAKTVTVTGGAAVSTTHNKFGGASIVLDGTGDSVKAATSADFAFASGQYTIEGWFYRVGTGTYQTLFDFRSASPSTNGLILGITDSNQFYVYNNYNFIIGPTATTLAATTWTHVALSNDGTGLKLWVNGTQAGATYVSAIALGTSQPLSIGSDPADNYAFNGYVDEVRVSSAARYTSTFTSPTTAFTNDNSTVLLIHSDTTIADDVSDDVYYLPLFK